MKHWWQGLAPRERLLVGGGGLLALILLGWALLWSPFSQRLAELDSSVSEQRVTYEAMREDAGRIRQLQAGGGARSAGLGGRSLLAVVDQSVRAGRLAPALRHLEPEGRDRVRLRLEGAAFDELVLWLDQLQTRHGIRAEAVDIEAAEAPGRVDARLTLAAAAP
ncbi:type II secretion system protein GspM [Thiohalobacter sp.]|uniref:type II secretion system protein GspM n=1 Tax=Thiohalobacter sp. TaxID=2025948 RepID=UPI00262BB34C|nr:type II secretion system protein GspM [Thiohalobacter sp.]